MYLPLELLCVALVITAETKIGFPVPPSYGDVVIWPGDGFRDGKGFVMVSLAPDGWDDNTTNLYHVCAEGSSDIIRQVITNQLGFNRCPIYPRGHSSTRGGISCSDCAGSENHILRCCNSANIISCDYVLFLSDPCHSPKLPLINRENNDWSGNEGYKGEVLLFPPVPNISLSTPASVSMGLVAVKKECQDCSYWRFIRKNTDTVDMLLVTTLCRQMGFTHVNPGFVITLKEAVKYYNYNFSYWAPAMSDHHLTSDIRCSRSQRCLGCCSYEASCDDEKENLRSSKAEANDDLLVIRCSFYPDHSISPGGDEDSCKFVNCKHSTSSCFSFTNLDDVKLQGNSTQNNRLEGRLEYFKESQWHTICSNGFDQKEADLVCQKLGYSSAVNYGNATSMGYGSGSTGVPLHLSCTGNHSSSCTVRISTCKHAEDVAIVCTNQSNGKKEDTVLIIVSAVLGIAMLVSFIFVILQTVKCVCNRIRQAGYDNLDQQRQNQN